MQRNLLGIISVDFNTTNQLLIIYCAFVKYLGKILGTQRSSASAVYRLQEKSMIQLEWRSCIIYISIEFGMPMKLLRLIKMCLNETCSIVRVGKNLSEMFRIRKV
jgi:hypothetical protein